MKQERDESERGDAVATLRPRPLRAAPAGTDCTAQRHQEQVGRKAITTRSRDMAGSTLKKPIRGRRMGVGAELEPSFLEQLRKEAKTAEELKAEGK